MRLYKISKEYYTPLKQVEINIIRSEKMIGTITRLNGFIYFLPLDGIDAVLFQIPDFKKEVFLRGAKRAFEIIVTAFAEADLETLGGLTTKKTFKKFFQSIHS